MRYPELQTARLLLRPLQLADAEQTQRLFPRWEIVRFLTAKVPWPYPEGRALESYRESIMPAIDRGDEWHWTLRLKTAPEQHIGVVSLYRDEWDSRGYWLGLPWQGKGLMTEAVRAVNDYWFDVLRFPVLRAPKAVANTGSRRISEETGMRLIATTEREYVSGRLPAELWEITAKEWHAVRMKEGLQGDLMPGRIVLLNGTSSAGKTTLATALRPALGPEFCYYASDQLADAGFRPLGAC